MIQLTTGPHKTLFVHIVVEGFANIETANIEIKLCQHLNKHLK